MTIVTHPVVVERLSKRYKIGRAEQETMLREKMVNILKRPFRRSADAYDTFWALRNVSFSIKPGEVVGVIGRNGAGKSTLLKVLSKITFPTECKVKVQGRVASLLEVGTGFHEELTGRENIYLNGSILGMTRKEVVSKLDAIIQFSGVEKFIDTPIKRFSSGMRLRLGFAVAAHLDPDILIVDEVLAVGDAAFQRKCLSAMEDLQRGGRTVLFVSHNMAAVENLCTRGIWIDEGQVRMDGPSHDVIQEYMNTFSGMQEGGTEFDETERRRGNGDVRYTQLEILSTDGQPLPVLRSGNSVKLRFHYVANKPVPHPSFGFRLTTELGTLVTETSTWHHGLDIPVLHPGVGWIDLDIDSLNLLPARYFFSLWLTGEAQTIYDGLEFCSRLDVEPSNIYQSSRVIDGRYGVVYFPQRWNTNGLTANASRLG
jgi:lipopolysaccharide transport system ATP-binding protein